MSRSHNSHLRKRRAPRWFNNLFVVRPERQLTRVILRKVLLMEDLQDTPELPKGNKPNAEWSWD